MILQVQPGARAAARALLGALLVLRLTMLSAQAQVQPALSTDTANPFSQVASPVSMLFQAPAVAFSVTGHHLGLLDGNGATAFKEGHLVLSTPRLFSDRVGIGLAVSYFTSPIFRNGRYGVNVAFRLLSRLAVGVNLAAVHIGYYADNFDHDQPDPVFSNGYSRISPSLSAGLYWRLHRTVGLSFGVRDLLRPNLALSSTDPVRAEPTVYGGLVLGRGRFKTRFEFEQQQSHAESRVMLELASAFDNYVRVGVGFDPTDPGRPSVGRLEAQMAVAPRLLVNIGVLRHFSDLGTAAMASVRAGVVLRLGRESDMLDELDPLEPMAFTLPAFTGGDPVQPPRGRMGRLADGSSVMTNTDELPFGVPHPGAIVVGITAFEMDLFEVSVADYLRFLEEIEAALRPALMPDTSLVIRHNFTLAQYFDAPKHQNYPVIGVTHDQAAQYCNFYGKRLPTEAEWEYAARGGVLGRIFPWGSLDTRDADGRFLANYYPGHIGHTADGYAFTAPVDAYPPSAWGFYNLAGNVAEWVQDAYTETYAQHDKRDPLWVDEQESRRVIRGGSWNSYAFAIGVGYRAPQERDAASLEIGFRCVADITN